MKIVGKVLFVSVLVTGALVSCGGGGGGGDGSDLGGFDGPVSSVVNGPHWLAQAAVSSDSCGERISAVTQEFVVDQGGGSVLVDTGAVVLSGDSSSGGFTVGFSEANGLCQREYVAQFSDMSSSTANVKFTSSTNCGTQICKSEWVGTASRVG